ncbi:phage integrase family protein [Paraburkholderia caledonica]|uniref:phage integrase family protein n=1 Tax=Paraburkholderia caledonica TaxID=134536 RepID=UPI000A0150A4|nr:phage integrase family protein [Paraburkholderia caledonica]
MGSAWFRPLVAKRLKEHGIASLGELFELCNAKVGSVPRIGVGRPCNVVGRLRQHEHSNGKRDRTAGEPMPIPLPRQRLHSSDSTW